MAARQLTLDWFGGMLDHVPCPATSGVSSETLRAVLQAVYGLPARAGVQAGSPCWAGQVAIAAEATRILQRAESGERRAESGEQRAESQKARKQVSERTARRALAVLESDLQYLVSYRASRPEARTRRTLDHYVIQWTEIGAALDRARDVTKQPATRPAPATRPGVEDEATEAPIEGEWPVDRPAWPVDRPAWPVDRPAWPVDRRGHTISARAEYGQEQELISTPTPYSHSPSRTEPDGADGRTDWVAVVEALRDLGVGTARQRADEMRRGGLSASDALAEVHRLGRVAAAQAWKFHAGVGAALAYRLRRGDWPCAVDEDLETATAVAVGKAASRAESAWAGLVNQAWREVRQRTAKGTAVDDSEVVRVAVGFGVPEEWAKQDRGLG